MRIVATRRPALSPIRRIAAAAALLSLGACAPIGRSREPTMFVPDQRLYAQIAEIEHVTKVSVQFEDNFGSHRMYSGEVAVDATANATCVLDQVQAILWQGRPGDIDVGIVQGETYVDASALGLSHDAMKRQPWIDRYGTHPLAGPSPKPSPRPAPPAGGPCG